MVSVASSDLDDTKSQGSSDENEGEWTVSSTSTESEASCGKWDYERALKTQALSHRLQNSASLSVSEFMHEYPIWATREFKQLVTRPISDHARICLQVPVIQEDFYLNILDWSSTNVIALAAKEGPILLAEASRLEHADDDKYASVAHTFMTTPRGKEGESEATCIKWSEEGERLAVGYKKGDVEVWDVETHKRVRHIKTHDLRVGVMDWVPDSSGADPVTSYDGRRYHRCPGMLLTSGSRDKTIVHHDLRMRNPLITKLKVHKQEICGLKWQPSIRDRRERLRELTQFHQPPNFSDCLPLAYCDPLSDIRPVIPVGGLPRQQQQQQQRKWTPEWTALAEALEETQLRKSRQKKPDDVVRESDFENMARSFNDEENINNETIPCNTNRKWGGPLMLASGGNDNLIHVWEMGYNDPIARISAHRAAIKGLAWSPTEVGILASGGGTNDRMIHIWDVSECCCLGSIETESQICNLTWSPVTNELASSHGYTLNQINIWSLAFENGDFHGSEFWGPSDFDTTKRAQRRRVRISKAKTMFGHTSRVLYMALSPAGTHVCTAAGDMSLRVWDAFTYSDSC